MNRTTIQIALAASTLTTLGLAIANLDAAWAASTLLVLAAIQGAGLAAITIRRG